jgi:hypothetical protein
MFWIKLTAAILLFLVAIQVGLSHWGASQWEQGTQLLRSKLQAAQRPNATTHFDARELEGLPAPVQRYFRLALKDGQAIVQGVHVEHSGTFNMSQTDNDNDNDGWKPFTSDQQVVTNRPGFDWNAEITMFPGLPVRVHDAYIAGQGVLHAAMFGLFSVANLRGGGEIARGELMRYLAEAVWYPTALLPSQGVRWEAVDAHSARASLTDEGIDINLVFGFGEMGMVTSVRADARGRTVGKRVELTPWEGHFWNFAQRDGMTVPLDGEVSWVLPTGRKPYWRGTSTAIAYKFER